MAKIYIIYIHISHQFTYREANKTAYGFATMAMATKSAEIWEGNDIPKQIRGFVRINE